MDYVLHDFANGLMGILKVETSMLIGVGRAVWQALTAGSFNVDLDR